MSLVKPGEWRRLLPRQKLLKSWLILIGSLLNPFVGHNRFQGLEQKSFFKGPPHSHKSIGYMYTSKFSTNGWHLRHWLWRLFFQICTMVNVSLFPHVDLLCNEGNEIWIAADTERETATEILVILLPSPYCLFLTSCYWPILECLYTHYIQYFSHVVSSAWEDDGHAVN